MPELIWYQNKTMQSGIFSMRYRTEMTGAGIPMLALVLWMLMPTYDYYQENSVADYFYCSRVSEVFKQKTYKMFSDIILLSAEHTLLLADNIMLSLTITCYQLITPCYQLITP
jgi:hypothetical protein